MHPSVLIDRLRLRSRNLRFVGTPEEEAIVEAVSGVLRQQMNPLVSAQTLRKRAAEGVAVGTSRTFLKKRKLLEDRQGCGARTLEEDYSSLWLGMQDPRRKCLL